MKDDDYQKTLYKAETLETNKEFTKLCVDRLQKSSNLDAMLDEDPEAIM